MTGARGCIASPTHRSPACSARKLRRSAAGPRTGRAEIPAVGTVALVYLSSAHRWNLAGDPERVIGGREAVEDLGVVEEPLECLPVALGPAAAATPPGP